MAFCILCYSGAPRSTICQYHMFFSHKLTYNHFGFSYWQLARQLPGLLKLEATFVTWNWHSICCPSFLYEKFSQLGNILIIFMKMPGADRFGNVETRRWCLLCFEVLYNQSTRNIERITFWFIDNYKMFGEYNNYILILLT